jgi:hypothetical protein
MKFTNLRVRLLAVLGGATVASLAVAACGSDPATSSTGSADAADDRADGAGDELATARDSSVSDTSVTDSAGDELPPTIRRPFLVGSSMRSARGEARDDWSSALSGDSASGDALLSAITRRELARVWLADALEEHASVAAFARFTMLMLSVGAPPELVVASQRASLDEVNHARDCFALANRYGDGATGPGALDVHDSIGPMSLADLAALTAEEGCVGETLGAALATEQLALVTDPVARRVLARIAKDEARHAELAWRFVAWAVAEEQRGSLGAAGVLASVTSAVHHAVRSTRAMTIRPCVADLEHWHAHGRVTCAEAREASERAVVEVVLPCLAALSRGPLRSGASERTACSHLRG